MPDCVLPCVLRSPCVLLRSDIGHQRRLRFPFILLWMWLLAVVALMVLAYTVAGGLWAVVVTGIAVSVRKWVALLLKVVIGFGLLLTIRVVKTRNAS